MKRGILSLTAFLLIMNTLQARARIEEKELRSTLQANTNVFSPISVSSKKGEYRLFSVELNKKPIVIGRNDYFTGIRFRTPKKQHLDMVWIFSVPNQWSHWYILPISGKGEGGFKSWFNADRLYEEFPSSDDRIVILQTLSADVIEPNAEYLIWFQSTNNTRFILTGAISFVPKEEEEWDISSIEESLGLKYAPIEQQVEHMKSRGGKILLDGDFFEPGYAESKLDSYFFTKRQTKEFGEFYITMKITCPPCETEPSLLAIEKKYGAPDFIISDKELQMVSDFDEEDESPNDETWYYDTFGFVTRKDDRKKTVQAVESQVVDYSSLRPKRKGLSFSDVPMTEMRVFYKDGREIARCGFWGDSEFSILSGELAKGNYRTYYNEGNVKEQLTYEGDGKWICSVFYSGGELYRKAQLINHAFDGNLTDYYPDGKTKVSACYKNGRLNGIFKRFDENGKLAQKITFKNGEQVEETTSKTRKDSTEEAN